MIGGKLLQQLIADAFECFFILKARRESPVSDQGLLCAKRFPLREAFWLIQEVEQNLIVIAAEMMGLELMRWLQQPLDDTLGVGTPVDIIAKIDEHAFACGALAVGQNGFVQLIKKVGAAVNIANGIDAHALWCRNSFSG